MEVRMMKPASYKERLELIRVRDIETYKYHHEHPEAKLCNARDRKAGYNSRQAVYEAILRIRRMVETGELRLEVTLTARKTPDYTVEGGENG